MIGADVETSDTEGGISDVTSPWLVMTSKGFEVESRILRESPSTLVLVARETTSLTLFTRLLGIPRKGSKSSSLRSNSMFAGMSSLIHVKSISFKNSTSS